MELNLWDYLKAYWRGALIIFLGLPGFFGILRFFWWVNVELDPSCSEKWVEYLIWSLAVVGGIITIFALYAIVVTPIMEYFKDRAQVRNAAAYTHWEGALAKAMRDLGKAMKDGNQIGIDKTAAILLKEIQIQCSFARNIREMEVKLEGICEGILADSPESIAEKIGLKLAVNHEDRFEDLILTVSENTYKRSLQQVN